MLKTKGSFARATKKSKNPSTVAQFRMRLKKKVASRAARAKRKNGKKMDDFLLSFWNSADGILTKITPYLLGFTVIFWIAQIIRVVW